MTNITSKESYLAYRADWKLRYKALSAEIRNTKTEFKKAQRGYSAHANTNNHVDVLRLQRLKANQRAEATKMLLELENAKKEAQSRYLAEKVPEGPTQG